MNLQFRDSTQEDLLFYQSILTDSEWCRIAGFSPSDFISKESIIKYITPQSSEDIRLVIWGNNPLVRLGFCHFKKIKPYTVESLGGLSLRELQKGIGIHAFIQILNRYFKEYPNHKVVAKVVEDNNSSLRMHNAIGFICVGDTFLNGLRFFKLEITPKLFYNNKFVRYFLAKTI